jgi:CPA2 family monovalent cation:H+ antiporter-2
LQAVSKGPADTVEVVSETLEAAMMIAAHALLLLDMPSTRVVRRIQEQRGNRYRLLREFIRGDGGLLDDAHAEATILG